MLSPNHLKNICLHNQEGCCRYLDQDDFDYSKCYCLKLRKSAKDAIDTAVKKKLEEYKKKGLDPYEHEQNFGDNCAGYPYLKTLMQGYDV